MNKYKFTEKMQEVSGFGGDYEATCRRLICRGAEWIENNPDKDLNFTQLVNVFGVVNAKNSNAKEIIDFITDGEKDLTGAMVHQAVVHLLYIKNKGWDSYVEVLEKQNDRNQT